MLLRAGVVLLAALGVVVARSIVGTSVWFDIALAVLAGLLVGSVLYVTTPIVYGRALGILAFFAAAIALLTGGPWRWFAALPFVVAAVLVGIRWRGLRAVDAVPRDRTLVPFSFDDGDRLVDTLDAVWGSTRYGGRRHGLRAAHSHGSVVMGTWVRDGTCGSPPSDVPLFDHAEGTVVARFSNFRGEVRRDDRRRMAHGLALELQAPGEASFAMVLVDVRRFPVATKEDFVALTKCAGARGLRRFKGFANLVIFGRTPIPALVGSMPWRRVNSYAERTYHGLNTFYCKLDGNKVPVRYLVAPVDAGAAAVQPATAARTRLDGELQTRLRSGRPLRFAVELVIGRRRNGTNLSDDLVRDPTRWWGRRRERLRLCTVTLDQFVPTDKPDRFLFEPFEVPIGFRPSDDEILSARRTAYATSYLRRCPLDEVSP
jgi:catalase